MANKHIQPTRSSVPWIAEAGLASTIGKRNPLAKQERDDKLIHRALAAIESRARKPGVLMTKPSFVADWFRLKLSAYDREVFAVAWLDVQYRLIEFRELFAGTFDRADVHLREVAKSALACNAAAGIFAHNHPSGYAEPSVFDLELTEYLQMSLAGLGVAVLDHWVVTPGLATSTYVNSRKINRLGEPSALPQASAPAQRNGVRPARTRDD